MSSFRRSSSDGGRDSTRQDTSPRGKPNLAQGRPTKTLTQTVKLEEIVAVKKLGSGGYGEVIMVRDGLTRMLYALKMVRKAALLRRAELGALNCERMIRERNVRCGGPTAPFTICK